MIFTKGGKNMYTFYVKCIPLHGESSRNAYIDSENYMKSMYYKFSNVHLHLLLPDCRFRIHIWLVCLGIVIRK